MSKNSWSVRSVSAVAIIGLSLGLGAPAAVAQDTGADTSSTTSVSKANIDFSKTGSLSLYKKAGAESTEHATGQAMEGIGGEALPGVKFKITKLNFNLQTDDWTKFPKAAADVKPEDKTATTFDQVTAEGTGLAKFENLELGLYLVEETEVPEGVVKGAPFLVSIPMVNEASDAWNYDVVAYPKNSKTLVEKKVEDADKNIQDAYTYTITADAPQFGGDKKLTKFVFSDQLDKRLTDPQVVEVKAGETVLESGDYEAKLDEATNTYTVTLTQSGIDKVKSGVKMALTFSVKRTTVGDTAVLTNTADVIFNNPNTGDEVKQTTKPVETYHGKLKVVKKDGNEADKVLEGAEFELYRSVNGTCGDDDDAKITIDGKDKWTTGADGTFTVDGLHVTNIEDNDKQVAKKYCLKETKAPAGYALPTEPVTEFTMTTTELAASEDKVTLTKEIANVKEDTPNLPFTGGAGIGVLAAIGAALVAAGAWFARRTAKKA